jgi:hypothetical protein
MAANVRAAIDSLAGYVDRDDIASLACQGFVSAEKRPSGRLTYKLRWRRDGRQRVCYLGSDPAVAARVQAAVAALQQPKQAERELNKLYVVARRALREVKATLTPPMAASGYGFHGYSARRKSSPVDE